MTSPFEEPPLGMDLEGLHLLTEDATAKLAKKSISPSLITSLENCPAKWAAETLVLRDLIKEEPDNAARRGQLYHKVMENFFALEPQERTKKRVKEEVDAVLASEEFKDMASMPEAVQWLREAINGYYSMGGKPELVRVAKVPDDRGNLREGLEVFVKGKIGNSSRETLGFIDRVVEDPRASAPEGASIVEDWKSGSKAKQWNPKTKSTDGLAEARQQVIYAKLLKARGITVTGARLLYPVARTIVNVDLKDENFAARVVEDVEKADEKLDLFIERNTFEFQPSFLCAWCPLSPLCPRATIKPYKKMQDAYAQQPSQEVLLQGFELL